METRKETIEWESPTEGVMTVITQREVTDEKTGYKGTKKEEINMRTNMETLLSGQDAVTGIIATEERKVKELRQQKEKLGNIPVEKEIHKKLAKQLQEIQIIQEAKKIDKQISDKIVEIEHNKKWMEDRQKLIDSAPKE